jgi:hypothetical protein
MEKGRYLPTGRQLRRPYASVELYEPQFAQWIRTP